jgi:hypothetical protein
MFFGPVFLVVKASLDGSVTTRAASSVTGASVMGRMTTRAPTSGAATTFLALTTPRTDPHMPNTKTVTTSRTFRIAGLQT